MKSISHFVEDWVLDNPLIYQLMADGLINYSSLARRVKPEIESGIGEKVSIESITIALNRLGKQHNQGGNYLAQPLDYIANVSAQTNLTIFNFTTENFSRVSNQVEPQPSGEYFVSTKGVWNASIICSSNFKDVDKLKKACLSYESNLTAVTVKLTRNHTDQIGVCAGMLTLLANKGVHLSEVISTVDELTIIIRSNFLQTTLQTLIN